MLKLSFVLYGEPMPCKRPRFNGKFAYNDPEYTKYKLRFADEIRRKAGQYILPAPAKNTPERSVFLNSNRYSLSVFVYRSAERGDIDNFIKTVQDALQDSGMIADDAQIDRVLGEKHIDKVKPRIEFILEQTKCWNQASLFGKAGI